MKHRLNPCLHRLGRGDGAGIEKGKPVKLFTSSATDGPFRNIRQIPNLSIKTVAMSQSSQSPAKLRRLSRTVLEKLNGNQAPKELKIP